MKKGILLAFGGLILLTGCDVSSKPAATVPVTPKWKGQPYRIAFDKPAAKPDPVGVTIPAVKYTANPDALERRATLVVRFDNSSAKNPTGSPMVNKMIMAPVDIKGEEESVGLQQYRDKVSR